MPPRFKRSAGRQAAAQAARSASGHWASRRDRTFLEALLGRLVGRLRHGTAQAEFHQLAHQVAEHFVGLQGLEPAVEVDGGLDIAVPQHAPNGLVIARMCLEPHGCSGMPKLVRGEAKAAASRALMVAITATAASRMIETIATFGCGTFHENWPRLGPAARNRPVRMPTKAYPIQPPLKSYVTFLGSNI